MGQYMNLITYFLSIQVFEFVTCKSAPYVKVQDSTVKFGENATIHCHYQIFDGNLTAISWWNSPSFGTDFDIIYNSHTDTNPNGRYSNDITQAGLAILTISNSVMSDNGYYQCTVTDSDILVTSDSGKLTVQYYLGAVVIDTYIDERNVTITCSVKGYPTPQLKLFMDNTVIKVETTTILIYKIVFLPAVNGGRYKCEAINIAETKSKTSERIIVNYHKPDIVLRDDFIVGPGEYVVLSPNISANPSDVTYEWVSNPPGIIDRDNDTATFTFRVSEVVGTIYTVTVTVMNSFGSATKSATITVQISSSHFKMEYVAIIIPGVLGIAVGMTCYIKSKCTGRRN